MKIVSYKCNVCGDIYTNEKAVERIKSIYFTGDKKFEIKDHHNAGCDNHICVYCIESFISNLSK